MPVAKAGDGGQMLGQWRIALCSGFVSDQRLEIKAFLIECNNLGKQICAGPCMHEEPMCSTLSAIVFYFSTTWIYLYERSGPLNYLHFLLPFGVQGASSSSPSMHVTINLRCHGSKKSPGESCAKCLSYQGTAKHTVDSGISGIKNCCIHCSPGPLTDG